MANGHGGKRKGSGRKPGGTNKRHSRQIVLEAIARGETPLDYFLSIMKDETQSIERRDAAAGAALPYMHPRLSAIDQTTTLKGNALAEILKAIDGSTSGIDTGSESSGGSPLETEQPVSHH